MEIYTEPIHGHYLVSAPSTGAVSLFSPAEYLAFQSVLREPEADRKVALRNLLFQHGCGEKQIESFSNIFLRKLEQQGWLRKERIDPETKNLQTIYFSITTKCNLSCIYCYIGDERRKPDFIMEYDDALIILKKIRESNPNARLAVTGGEPLTHPDLFRILDAIEEFNLSFSLGTNAVLADDSFSEKLKQYKHLLFVQASLDGFTPEIHAITRGNTFHETLKGIKNLIKHKIPLAIAPTLHEGNIHEIEDIARFAYSNGCTLSPNHLRKFPHAPHGREISLKPESLRKCIIETFEKINHDFQRPVQLPAVTDSHCEQMFDTRCRYVCGNAGYTLDIDWNGDVYPCHLLRDPGFILGNILKEEFSVILERGRTSKTRVKAYEIPKCKSCAFVATCAGGCRASALYTKGTLAAEDEYCEILYKFEVDKLFLRKDIPFHL
jgi:radical SAM protein with 4Fe4S-binding SPASM domain